jgi:hypothetical protein
MGEDDDNWFEKAAREAENSRQARERAKTNAEYERAKRQREKDEQERRARLAKIPTVTPAAATSAARRFGVTPPPAAAPPPLGPSWGEPRKTPSVSPEAALNLVLDDIRRADNVQATGSLWLTRFTREVTALIEALEGDEGDR